MLMPVVGEIMTLSTVALYSKPECFTKYSDIAKMTRVKMSIDLLQAERTEIARIYMINLMTLKDYS